MSLVFCPRYSYHITRSTFLPGVYTHTRYIEAKQATNSSSGRSNNHVARRVTIARRPAPPAAWEPVYMYATTHQPASCLAERIYFDITCSVRVPCRGLTAVTARVPSLHMTPSDMIWCRAQVPSNAREQSSTSTASSSASRSLFRIWYIRVRVHDEG